MYTNYTLKCFGRQGASADMVCTMSVGQFAVSSSRLSYAIIGLFEGRDKLRQRLYDTNFLCLGVWQLYDQRYFCRATHFDRWPAHRRASTRLQSSVPISRKPSGYFASALALEEPCSSNPTVRAPPDGVANGSAPSSLSKCLMMLGVPG